MGELVPMKHRYFAHAFMYAFGYPGGGFGAAIGAAFVAKHPSVGWRGIYWLLLGAEVLTLVLWVCFYFPPSFKKKHGSDINSKMYWIKNFDYVGTLLFAAGSVIFLLGISWGGSVYPWKSAAVITSITGGALTLLIFGLWEAYAPLKEPLMPAHLFKSVPWIASLLLVSISAGVYYAFAIIWPAQVAVLYGDGNPIWIGLVSSLLSIAFVTGQVFGGLVARLIGHTKIQSIVVFFTGGTFLGCMAVSTPDNPKTAMTLLFLGAFFVGWNETIALANATLLVRDQREIGIGGGLATTTRAFISAILQAVYTTIFSNRLTTNITEKVPSALISAGLPANSVAQFLSAISVGTASAFNAVPGISDTITAVGLRAYKIANSEAYKTVYLSTIAFTAIGLICAFLTTDMDEFMSDKVAVTLANEDNEFGRRLDMERKLAKSARNQSIHE
jgi:MFS family permease